MKKFLLLGVLAAVLATAAVLEVSAQTKTITVTAPTFNSACMQSATTARDNALISAVSGYSPAVTAALTTRRDALNAAWGNTNTTARNKAVQAALKAYGKSVRDAQKALRTAKTSAWKTYGNTVKNTCKTSAGSVTSSSDPL